jgi:hypothetical protein
VSYGVWIPGTGWLRPDPNLPLLAFATTEPLLARAARDLYGGRARVLPIGELLPDKVDQSMVELEPIFMQREAERRALRLKPEKWGAWVRAKLGRKGK